MGGRNDEAEIGGQDDKALAGLTCILCSILCC